MEKSMSEKKERLRVWDSEEFGRYLVESEAGDQPYMVDLTARVKDGKAYGYCSCTFFSTQANPNFEKTGKYVPYRRGADGKLLNLPCECKHLSAVRNHFLMHVTMPMLARMTNGIEQ